MYEDKTYDNLLDNALNEVTQDVDKREGSIIHDAVAPCMLEIANMYFELSNFVDLFFADTSEGEYLDRVVKDKGLTRKASTYAIRKIETNKQIAVGTRWGIEDLIYTVTEEIDTTHYKAICNTKGAIGNVYSGLMDNIDNISNIEARLTDILSSGADTETDEELRERYYIAVRNPGTSGNSQNYKDWALKVAGVGDAKVFPLWNGNGTVKVIVVNSDKMIDDGLVAPVKEYIETVRPVGAEVTIATPTANNISVTATVQVQGVTVEEVETEYNKVLQDYFASTVFDTYTISYARIGSLLLSCTGVVDYTDLLINGDTNNITIAEDEIPVLQSATLS